MHKYLFVPQSFPDTYRSLAHTSINADFPSGKLPPLSSVFVSRDSFALSRYSFVFSANVAWEIPYTSTSLLSILPPFSTAHFLTIPEIISLQLYHQEATLFCLRLCLFPVLPLIRQDRYMILQFFRFHFL